MKVAFIGLGAMGQGMAGNLLKAGFDLRVYNRSAARAASLVERGAKQASTPAEAAKDADVVFSMLFDDNAVEVSTFGPDGLANTLRKGGIHMCGSTLSVAQATRLRDEHAKLGQSFVATPVLGRPPAAASGDLFVIAAGESEAVRRVHPVLEAVGQRVFEAGPDPVHSVVVKLGLNFSIFATIEQMAEVLTTCEKAGVDPHTMYDIMTNSFFTAPVHRNYGRLMVDQNYDNPGAGVSIGLKDTELFLAAGKALGVPQPYASIARDRFVAAIANGDGNRDFVVLQERVRSDAGLSPPAASNKPKPGPEDFTKPSQ